MKMSELLEDLDSSALICLDSYFGCKTARDWEILVAAAAELQDCAAVF